MAFSKTRSMTPLSLSSVSMVRSVTCFISWLNFWGVNLFRMLRTFLKSSCEESKRRSLTVSYWGLAAYIHRKRQFNVWHSFFFLHSIYNSIYNLIYNYELSASLRVCMLVYKCAPTCVFRISGSSAALSLFNPGFQAFSDFFSWTSSFTDKFMMIFLGGGLRAPMFKSCEYAQQYIMKRCLS